MSTIAEGIKNLGQDQSKFAHYARRQVRSEIDPHAYAIQFGEGAAVFESDAGFSIVKSSRREIIPISFHMPHGVRRAFRSGEFTFSVDQKFEAVMEDCSVPRKGDGFHDRWIRYRTKHNLRELRDAGVAHTLEVYVRNEPVAGIIGLHIGALFVSLSVFSRFSGAGNVALYTLQVILARHGFLLHDVISPSNISRHFGGQLISAQEDFILRRKAIRKLVDFPTVSTNLSVTQYIGPH